MSHSKFPGDENAETQSKTEYSQKEASQSTDQEPGPQEDPRSASQARSQDYDQTRCRCKSCSGEITNAIKSNRRESWTEWTAWALWSTVARSAGSNIMATLNLFPKD
jgi:hypothetical protein